MFSRISCQNVVLALWFQATVSGAMEKTPRLRALHGTGGTNNETEGDSDNEGKNDESGAVRTLRASLLPSTGFNDICGEKIMATIPQQMQQTGRYNSIGTKATPLTPEMCSFDADELVATYVDKHYYHEVEDWPLPDDRLLNLPYSEVPVSVELDGTRAFVPNHMTTIKQPTATHSIPNKRMTIGSFTSITGEMQVLCKGANESYVTIDGLNYAPNSVLSVWSMWSNHVESGLPPLTNTPLGGLPNMVLADRNGRFRFERKLDFCPLDKQNNGQSIVIAFSVAKHLDGGCTHGTQSVHSNYTFVYKDGTMFSSSGVGPGLMTVDQGHVSINALNETD